MVATSFSAAIADLQARTEYESWLLEDVYEIADVRLIVQDHDQVVFPPGGGPANQTILGVGNIHLGDWRPGFLDAGAPLVFVTAFKLLDMLLEWVLTGNGITSTHQFTKKLAALKGPIAFPSVIQGRPWLRDRLIGLYEVLAPLRGTIIHDRHFKSTSGSLTVASSKHGVGTPVSISRDDLRNLALILVSILGTLQGTWPMDAFAEKRTRRVLDELVHLHGLPSFSQPSPRFLNVRIYVASIDPVDVDLSQLRARVAALHPSLDLVYDLRIVAIDPAGSGATAFLVPWDDLQGPRLQKSKADMAQYGATVPADVNVAAIAGALNLVP